MSATTGQGAGKWLMLAALVLPVAWLGLSVAAQERALGGAREWRIPIEGYDPRDPLRGQYVRFTYGWTVAGDAQPCLSEGCMLCLSTQGGTVIATAQPRGGSCPFPVDLAASSISVGNDFRNEQQLQFRSRIFVSETRAPELEAQLREGPMVVVAALTPDGRLVNRRIEPAG